MNILERPPITDAKYQTVAGLNVLTEEEYKVGDFRLGHRNGLEHSAGIVRVAKVRPPVWVIVKLKDLAQFRCHFHLDAAPETIKTYVIGPKAKIQKRGQIFVRCDIDVQGWNPT